MDAVNSAAEIEWERARLVRLCSALIGDHAAAEDLAQEALLQAWRSRDTLRNPASRQQWLSGIARNVCRHWLRQRGRVAIHGNSFDATPEDAAADDELGIELERSELADLLDRALCLLPPDTRTVLLQRYLEDRCHADIARRLRMKEGTVKVKVQRGKLALRRVLAEHFPDDLAALGVGGETQDGWTGTRIWCWQCGQHRLMGRRSEGEFWLRCPGCCRDPHTCMTHTRFDGLPGPRWAGSYSAMFDRLFVQAEEYYRAAVTNGAAACGMCGRSVSFTPFVPHDAAPYSDLSHFCQIRCEACGDGNDAPLSVITLCLREGWDFRAANRRMRFVPEQELEYDGRPAVLTRLESVTGTGRLDAIYDRGTYRLLAIESCGA